MTSIQTALTIVALAIAIGSAAFAADGPAPTTTQPGLSDVRVQSLKGYTYAFISKETTLNTLQTAIGELIPKLDAAIQSGQIRPDGPVVFTYHGATQDHNRRFTLDVGAIVKAGGTAPPGFQIVSVPPYQCATLLYTGPVNMLGSAFGKVYGEIARQGLQPAEVFREAYLYWEEPDSANNVVQIQVELAAGL